MAEHRNIGEILHESGRISEKDIAAAVQYQQDHGGYFGEALVALGLLSPDVLEWGLASQFDLPYVFPDADSVDPNVASLVTPEWALARLTLPILSTGDTLTVVTDSPLRADAIEDLRALTDREIQLALASPAKIRELIRQVFARAAAQESEGQPSPAKLQEIFTLAREAGSTRFGISMRGHRGSAWYDAAGLITRRPLARSWEAELESLVEPPPSRALEEGGRHQAWAAEIKRDGGTQSVEVRYLGDEQGAEYLFRPSEEPSTSADRFEPPPPGILSEIRILARYGSARLIVTSEPAELGREILAYLPGFLLDPSLRCVHVTDERGFVPENSFAVELARDDPRSWMEEFEALRPFHFDVVTVDLIGNPAASSESVADAGVDEAEWVQAAVDIASVVLLLWEPEGDRAVPFDAGIRWQLHLRDAESGGLESGLEWSLDPVARDHE